MLQLVWSSSGESEFQIEVTGALLKAYTRGSGGRGDEEPCNDRRPSQKQLEENEDPKEVLDGSRGTPDASPHTK